jgi:hypothetical protein
VRNIFTNSNFISRKYAAQRRELGMTAELMSVPPGFRW